MDSLNQKRSSSKRKNKSEKEVPLGLYGIVKPGGYYFPGKISSGCFDGNGLIVDSKRKSEKEEAENIYESSLDMEYDPFGMYTGVTDDGDTPVQDADDL